MIKLKCSNDKCGYSYELTEIELRENGNYYVFCFVCGAKNKVTNIEEIVEKDLETQVKENVDLWFKKLGVEYTLEMCERNKNSVCYRLYKTELEKRGFKLKE
jgi:hypothetical protein